jgi:hypothetical protein
MVTHCLPCSCVVHSHRHTAHIAPFSSSPLHPSSTHASWSMCGVVLVNGWSASVEFWILAFPRASPRHLVCLSLFEQVSATPSRPITKTTTLVHTLAHHASVPLSSSSLLVRSRRQFFSCHHCSTFLPMDPFMQRRRRRSHCRDEHDPECRHDSFPTPFFPVANRPDLFVASAHSTQLVSTCGPQHRRGRRQSYSVSSHRPLVCGAR